MKRGMARMAGGVRVRVADMSLPAEQRRRNPKTTRKKGKGAVAQMQHAGGGRKGKRARQGERLLRRARKGGRS